MRVLPVKHFGVHDAEIDIWNQTVPDPLMNRDMETYEAIRMLLVRYGFTFRQDPRVKKYYRSLAPYHHVGERNGFAFKAEVSGMHTQLKFFEPAKASNPNGAEHDFDRLKLMSYLNRKRFFLLYRKIGELLRERGFECTDDPPPSDGFDWIRRRRDSDFSGRWAATGMREWIEDPIQPYNRMDADGHLMSEGDIRYGRDYHGHLIRGRVYYALNYMWLLVAADGAFLANNHCGAYFNWRPGLKRREVNPLPSLQAELKSAIAKENFERAIVLRDIIAISLGAKNL